MQSPEDHPVLPLIDPDELRIHRLYRERIVQEDNLINHRMTWMILSQAFMLAIWGVLVQHIFRDHPVHFRWLTHVTAAIGFLFAAGSKMAVRAAQDEIDELREKYLNLYAPSKIVVIHQFWKWATAIVDLHFIYKRQPIPFNSNTRLRRVSQRTDILPGLTGSQNFHQLGHLTPKVMPLLLMIMWICLFWAVHF